MRPPAGISEARTVEDMMKRPLAAAGIALMLVCIGFASFSSDVAVWWGRVSYGRSSALPTSIRHVLEGRPNLGEADVHALMWFVMACAIGSCVPSGVTRRITLLMLLGLSAGVELCQTAFTTRSAEWGDMAGNCVGVVLGALALIACSMTNSRSHKANPT